MFHLMSGEKASLLHEAARIIEADGVGGYWTVRKKFGRDVADALIVFFLRGGVNPDKIWPAPEGTVAEVNKILADEGILRDLD